MRQSIVGLVGGPLSGRPFWEANDCAAVVYALAKRVPYSVAHTKLRELGRKDRAGTSYSVLMRAYGPSTWDSWSNWAHTPIRLDKWALRHPKGRYIVRIRGHVFYVEEGVLHDTSPQFMGREVLQYWRLPT